MDINEYVLNLKGFVESLKLSDNISKRQLDMLYEKLDELTHRIDFYIASGHRDDEVARTRKSSSNNIHDDDLPF